jgi:hypothetical protein
MKRLTKKPWFGPKRLFGWGWSPCSWEGYLMMMAYIILAILIVNHFHEPTAAIESVAVLAVIFLVAIALTSDKPGGPGMGI